MTVPGGYGSFVRLHDAWMLDGAVARLMVDGRHDAVCLFFAAIAYSHVHDTDGRLTGDDLDGLERVVNTAGSGARNALIASRKLVIHRGGRGGTHYEIVQYAKWQTTRDQRERDAERKRTSRARPSKRKEGRKEGKKGTTPASVDNPAVVPIMDMDELYLQASAKIIDLNRETA